MDQMVVENPHFKESSPIVDSFVHSDHHKNSTFGASFAFNQSEASKKALKYIRRHNSGKRHPQDESFGCTDSTQVNELMK